MAQGDSISGYLELPDIGGEGNHYGVFIRPAIGEVWLITVFEEGDWGYPYFDIYLTNGVVIYEEPPSEDFPVGIRGFEVERSLITLVSEKTDIRLFIDHNFFIVCKGEGWITWSGIQFK